MTAHDRWDQRRAKKVGRGFVRQGQNRCLNCGSDPHPRTFYCSDRCSEESQANNSAALRKGKK